MENILSHLNFTIDHIEKTDQYLNGKSLNSIQLFSVGLLERLSKTAKGLKVLLSDINSNQDLEFSCGIILRSSLLDILIVQNLMWAKTKHLFHLPLFAYRTLFSIGRETMQLLIQRQRFLFRHHSHFLLQGS